MRNPYGFRNRARKAITRCAGFALILVDKDTGKLFAFGELSRRQNAAAETLNKIVEGLEATCFSTNNEVGDYCRIRDTSKKTGKLRGRARLRLVKVVNRQNLFSKKLDPVHGARRQLWDFAFEEDLKQEVARAAKTDELCRKAFEMGIMDLKTEAEIIDYGPEAIQRDLSIGDLVSECSTGEDIQPLRKGAVPEGSTCDIRQWHWQDGCAR